MFRALAVLRVVVLGYAVALNAYRSNFDHPVLGWVCVAVMVVATVAATVVYAAPERRVPAVLLADLALAVGLLLATPVVKGPWFQATIPGYWIVGALLAWAVRYGWRGGTVAAVLLGAVDLLTRDHVAQKDWGNVFLILLGGSMVGFVCESLKAMAAERDQAQREAAAAAERARLARAVHDGVLQVLSLVQRQGGELGRAAGAQEQALRTLIRSQDAVTATPQALAGHADLAGALGALGSRPGVEVALPAGTVALPAHAVTELAAVVGACLDNVERHVGADARAWVLVDDLGDRVEVSVRDEGPGIAPGRLEVAEQEGRLGVSESIRGRIRDLGGTASLDTGSYGTEWTFVVPREEDR
ncbi:MacS family sensor histidine kinase [Nocardioides nitrophenolicus]|uniref:MacS family sensor histidine kinase n=1 Tax=Nocardioides nitrophenolicus TaxID=60489 RepID=UPI001EF83389|nr:signal transduction histidine kinase [Nocardioides nitrophenolicus]